MLKIENNAISYTKGDTFRLKVTAKNGFLPGSYLKFVIAENEEKEPVSENFYNISGGAFFVNLNEKEREKLKIGEYIYKFTLVSPEGVTVTQKSGDFFVKWGA